MRDVSPDFLKKYPSASILINSINEEMVRLFLQGKIQFTSIIYNILNLIKDKKIIKYAIHPTNNLKQIYFLDNYVKSYIKTKFIQFKKW